MPRLKMEKRILGIYDNLLKEIRGSASVKISRKEKIYTEQLGKSIGFSGRTVETRLSKPDTITLGELRKIRVALGIPKDELISTLYDCL